MTNRNANLGAVARQQRQQQLELCFFQQEMHRAVAVQRVDPAGVIRIKLVGIGPGRRPAVLVE